jgi:hypothetical protein
VLAGDFITSKTEGLFRCGVPEFNQAIFSPHDTGKRHAIDQESQPVSGLSQIQFG